MAQDPRWTLAQGWLWQYLNWGEGGPWDGPYLRAELIMGPGMQGGLLQYFDICDEILSFWAFFWSPKPRKRQLRKAPWWNDECRHAKRVWETAFRSHEAQLATGFVNEELRQQTKSLWNVYRKLCRRFCHQYAAYTEQDRRKKVEHQPREYWQNLAPKPISQYKGQWSPEDLVDYYALVNRERFPLPVEEQGTVQQTGDFLDSWEEEYEESNIRECYQDLGKVDMKPVMKNNRFKAPGLDGETGVVSKILELIQPGIVHTQSCIGILAGCVRPKWRNDTSVGLLKPGKDDKKRETFAASPW